jgi:hypothetical protein
MDSYNPSKFIKPIIMLKQIRYGIKSTKKVPVLFILIITCMVLINCSGPSGDAGKNLEKGFMNPPESAKPRVWWHWMNGNITKEGIRADLEWMKRTGIGGFQNFDAGLSTPQVVEKRLIYMTPEWKDAFRFTTKLADSLGLEMAIAGSPGWSESGGPWVTPDHAMKKIVWSETEIEGGKTFYDTLPRPPSNSGVFQNVKVQGPDYYKDIAVIAFPVPSDEISMAELKPVITSSGGKFDLTTLTDGDLANAILLPASNNESKLWVQFKFPKPVVIQSVTLANLGARSNNTVLEVSNDGRQYKDVATIPTSRSSEMTVTFSPVTGRFFRVTFPPVAPQAEGIQVSELVLNTIARINHWEDKAGYSSTAGLINMATSSIPAIDAVKKDDIVDLTSKMQPDGKLEWTAPAGRWMILRIGYSLTGKTNSPASPEATGLEVDKLNAGYVKDYFDNYLDQYKDATGGLMGKRGLQYIITDSWEARTQNWTDSMMIEFSNRCGYDMLPWMPVLTGYIVESAESSERFLWDFRKTISDLTAEYHYDQLTTILHERNMGRYTESHESGRAFIADGMEVKRKADIPMSATWTPAGSEGVATRFKADVRESASVAHIYGQNLVAAESMTARGNTWAFSPERLKPTADMELASGLNRFVIHTSVHQPVNDKIPGLGLGPYGQWFTRHETWSEQALPWTTYLARSCYMLQQGKYVADVVYLYGQDNNITALFGNKLPDIPEGYSYDFVNADALVHVLSVENGQIITPGCTTYRLLAIDSSACYMSLSVLQKIRDMVNAGAVVTGPKPINSPSLSDDQSEFKSIADELWGIGTGNNSKGKINAGETIAQVLSQMNINPDFKYTKPEDNTELLFVHRRLKDADIYWVNNRNNSVENLSAAFRVEGKIPELWDPETGKISETSYKIENGHTLISMHLKPCDAVFVVFRKKAGKLSVDIPQPVEKQLAVIEGPWNISFQTGRGAPAEITLEELSPWNENADKGVKYFSGTGTYSKSIEVPDGWIQAGTSIWIDLGDVKNLAEVIVNGKSLGIVWKTPFRVDVTKALKKGENKLAIKVTNLWVNRLIGDQQPDETNKITYTTQAFYQADSPLLQSGLLGPVTITAVN